MVESRREPDTASTVRLWDWPGVRPVASRAPCQMGPSTWFMSTHEPEPTLYRTLATVVELKTRALTGLSVARQAGEQAYKMAGITAKDIDVAEVHDCFTIAEMMAYENLGFAGPGEGKELIKSKETYKEGSIPVNVDGGLLSKGHPIGATGGSQVRTIVLQLRGEAGDMQVKDADLGLVHNIGGVGLYGNVTILGR